jgi:hypothetical protein
MRPGVTWILVGAVVVVGLIAGIDALRSSGGEPPIAATERAVTTTKAVTTRKTEATSELHLDRVAGRLKPGRVSTDANVWPVVAFTVPSGWYGWQGLYKGLNTFVLGRGLNPEVETVDLTSGGLFFHGFDTTLAHVARRFEQAKGIRFESPVRIGGYSGRKYVAKHGVNNVSLGDIGVPPGSLEPGGPLILLGLQRRAVLIVPHTATTDVGRAEVNRVLMSFEFPH